MKKEVRNLKASKGYKGKALREEREETDDAITLL